MKTLFALVAGAIGLMVVTAAPASAASPAYCDGVAREYANSRAGGSAIAGGVVGGVVGGVLGKAIGGKKGVAPGIVAGGATGVVAGSATWRRWYNKAYYDCVNAPAPQPVYAPAPYGTARADRVLNIRSEPNSTNSMILWKLYPGIPVNVGQCTPSWCQVQGNQGEGWAFRQYLMFGG